MARTAFKKTGREPARRVDFGMTLFFVWHKPQWTAILSMSLGERRTGSLVYNYRFSQAFADSVFVR
ncbi:protein of unknown function [Georgfuchsia toluolica]|uniref:Uncharacterized protein n=1 Tax=Georgfuchsia toluolica TaxID=424218 RepID=A0A916J3R5_9PROT|nr:protein of unknown function [Georgfuchsia toluolica]